MDKISKIRVEGGFYDTQIDIKLRTKNKARVSTIYGNNGSGKSSIANAFYEFKHNSKKEFTHVSFLDNSNNELLISDKDKQNIWVFSDKYLDENINWNDDHLGAIVMFGEHGKIDNEINEKTNQLKLLESEIANIDVDKYKQKQGSYSIEDSVQSLHSILRKNWVEREKKILDVKRVLVTDKVVKQVTDLNKGKDSYKSLIDEFETKMANFSLIDKNQKKLQSFEIHLLSQEDQDLIHDLLSRRIQKPEGSILEEKILNLIINGNREMIEDSFHYFTNDCEAECPYCLQTVDNLHRELLLKSIRSILSEEVEEHSKHLSKTKEVIKVIEIDLDYLRKYKNEEIIEFQKKILSYNRFIDDIYSEIDKKLENPFDPINFEFSLKSLITEIQNRTDNLLMFVTDFNASVDSIESTKDYLLELNKRIARLEIDDNLKKTLFLNSELKREEEIYVKLSKNINEINSEIATLNAKKKSVDIALNDINRNLYQIFSGKNRISLKVDEEFNYRVMSRGKKIKLKKLSTGEKNVISLCYFFAQLRNNTSALNKYNNQYFVVLDDPISSLDFDHKIGIYAFLRKTLGDIIEHNDKSRVLILTHDLEVVHRFDNIFDDIKKSLKLPKDFSCNMRILSNKNTLAEDIGRMNNYCWNIQLIFEYACSNPDDDHINDFYIGNVLRKTLEAYATFNFRKGISGLVQDDTILKKITDDELRDYFRTRMIRLLLHSESHTEDRAKSFSDYDSFEQFSRSEKVQISKDVISLLYLIDKEHVKAYISNDKKQISEIEEWIKSCRWIE